MSLLRRLSQRLPAAITRKWLWFGLAAAFALRFYYVREMIAALIIFSVLFAAAAVLALVVFLLDRASQQIVIWAEPGVVRFVRWISDVPWIGDAAEAVVGVPAWILALPHRFRKELKDSEKP